MANPGSAIKRDICCLLEQNASTLYLLILSRPTEGGCDAVHYSSCYSWWIARMVILVIDLLHRRNSYEPPVLSNPSGTHRYVNPFRLKDGVCRRQKTPATLQGSGRRR